MATQAQITINAVAGSDTDLPLNTLVQLNNNGLGGETTYTWSILTQPAGPADVLSSTIIQAPTFTPTKEGSYLIRLIVNIGQPNEQTNTVVAAVRELETRNRIPAANETSEVSSTVGWSQTAVDQILQRVTRLTDSGIGIGTAGAAGLVPGKVVWVNDTDTIATGLPGQRNVPVYDVAHANVPVEAIADVFIVLEGVDGSITPALGDLIRVLQFGLYTGITYVGPAPSIGDAVYLSDTGTLALTPGTVTKNLGNVTRAGGGTYDAWLDPAAGSAISGPAGGVLGYPGSTYPNPNGLAPGDGVWAPTDVIPVKAGTNAVYIAVDARPVSAHATGSYLGLYPGAGSAADASNAGEPGGVLSLSGGDGGAAFGTTQVGGTGGAFYLSPGNSGAGANGGLGGIAAGAGGNSTAGFGAGNGGDLQIEAGAGGTGNSSYNGGDGGILNVFSGSGGTGASLTGGGDGGALQVESGSGGDYGGDAGDITITGGTGGDSNAAFNAGEGGSVGMAGGVGGARGAAGLPGNGGGTSLVGGAGGLGTGGSNGGFVTVTGGSAGDGGLGGSVNITGGSPGTASKGGNAGAVTIATFGGASNTSGFGGEGGYVQITAGNGAQGTTGPGLAGYISATAGNGGNGNGAVNAAAGGALTLVAGQGGNGTAGGAKPGLGGAVAIQGGTSGVNNGTANTAATGSGLVTVSSGNGAIGGTSGYVQVTTAPIATPGQVPTLTTPPVGMTGGSFIVKTQGGGAGDATHNAAPSGSVIFANGTGGAAATSAANGGAGGAFGVVSGTGGAGVAGHSGGAGGLIELQAGNGGASGGGTAGIGGAFLVIAGDGGSAGAGTGAAGGGIGLACGASTGNANGALWLGAAGAAGGSGTGGQATLIGGATATGTGGSAVLAGGSATGAGTGGNASVQAGDGSVADGDVLIGTVQGARVDVGLNGRDVRTFGRNVGVPTTYAPLAATTIPVNEPTIFLNPAANRDMTASPTLQTSGITAGTIVTLVNEDTTFYVDLTQDNGGTSYLKLATGNIFLYKYDSITLIFDGTYWVEVGRNVQPGKSYTPVAGTTIPVLCPVILLANAGNVDLGTANATIQTTGINAGTRVTFVQKGAGTTTFRRGGSTLLRLASPNHAVAQYGTLELVYDGANWCEIANSNNA